MLFLGEAHPKRCADSNRAADRRILCQLRHEALDDDKARSQPVGGAIAGVAERDARSALQSPYGISACRAIFQRPNWSGHGD